MKIIDRNIDINSFFEARNKLIDEVRFSADVNVQHYFNESIYLNTINIIDARSEEWEICEDLIKIISDNLDLGTIDKTIYNGFYSNSFLFPLLEFKDFMAFVGYISSEPLGDATSIWILSASRCKK